jgi:hypothetical protein
MRNPWWLLVSWLTGQPYRELVCSHEGKVEMMSMIDEYTTYYEQCFDCGKTFDE